MSISRETMLEAVSALTARLEAIEDDQPTLEEWAAVEALAGEKIERSWANICEGNKLRIEAVRRAIVELDRCLYPDIYPAGEPEPDRVAA